MALITAEQMLEALRQSVAAQGEGFVYGYVDETDACVYIDNDGAPSCLVGHALSRLLPGTWREVPGVEGNTDARSLDTNEEFLEYDAKLVAEAAQMSQDLRETWGEALSAAEEIYSDIARAREGV